MAKTKTTFDPSQLEAALKRLQSVDEDFPEYPITLHLGEDYQLWRKETFPITLRKVGADEEVTVMCEDYFGGEEDGDHAMYIVLKVGWGENARYFKKCGQYDSWDDDTWDGGFFEVEQKEVKKTEWVMKK